MSLRRELAGVLARDSRYSIEAYEFIFAALDHAKILRRKRRKRAQSRARRSRSSEVLRHVTGRELCEAARDLALELYGLLAITVLEQWGIRSTSDIGNVVYNLIASGDLEKTPSDSREDFDNVFDFETGLRQNFGLALDDVA